MTERAANPVRATETSLAVVEALREDGPAGVTEVAERIGASKGTTHNHLATLREAGFVVKDGDDGVYDVGFEFLAVGAGKRHEMELYRHCRPRLNELANEIDAWTDLMVEEAGEGVYLYHGEPHRVEWHLDTYAGDRCPLHCSALGKAILSEVPDERLDEVVSEYGLPAVTDETITDRDALREEVAAVRERGFATEDEERFPGVRSVAAPVTHPDGEVAGAISASTPISRVDRDTFERGLGDRVKKVAADIELNLRVN